MSDEDLTDVRLFGLAAILPVEYDSSWSQGSASSTGVPEAAMLLSEPGAVDAPDGFEEESPSANADESDAPVDIPDLPAAEIAAYDDTSAGASVGADVVPVGVPDVRPPASDDIPARVIRKNGRYAWTAALAVGLLLATVGWRFVGIPGVCRVTDADELDIASRMAADTVARRIVVVESGGDATAKNARSSATGAGQFLDGTWLDMIRAYRPDLRGRSETEILDLRHDPDLSREMVARFAEQNATMLASRCLPVTPGTLYLSHFAGGAGAVAVLSAPEDADAAATMAEADSTGHTTRGMIVTANPFLERFSVTDLKSWAERKMGAVRDRLSRM